MIMTTHSRRFTSAILGSFALIAAAVLAGQSQEEASGDLVLGTWVLDAQASTFTPGPPPKSQMRTYEETSDGIKVTIATVNAEGKSLSAEYVANYDSLEYPITGSNTVDAISLKQVNAYNAEATLRHAHKIIGTARRIISEDGKTMTIHYKGTNPSGEAAEIEAVYDKKAR